MFFMGNPGIYFNLPLNDSILTNNNILGDYAWGREGLDTIVTQLLNQMDNAGELKTKCAR